MEKIDELLKQLEILKDLKQQKHNIKRTEVRIHAGRIIEVVELGLKAGVFYLTKEIGIGNILKGNALITPWKSENGLMVKLVMEEGFYFKIQKNTSSIYIKSVIPGHKDRALEDLNQIPYLENIIAIKEFEKDIIPLIYEKAVKNLEKRVAKAQQELDAY